MLDKLDHGKTDVQEKLYIHMIVLHNDSILVRVFTLELPRDFKCNHSEGDVWKISTDYLKTKFLINHYYIPVIL